MRINEDRQGELIHSLALENPDCTFLLVSHSLLSIKPSSISVLAPMLVNHVPNLAFPLTTIDT